MASSSLPEGFDPFAGAQLLAAAPSTEPQREVWTSSQISQDANLAYNESISVVLDGALDADAMERSLRQLVERHEALRATFSGDGEKLLVNAQSDIPLKRIDLSSKSEAERSAQLSALLESVVTTPFDLEKGPLARAELVKLSPTRHQLVFTAHHIICDGWSAAVLMKDWGLLYSATVTGKAADLPKADPISAYSTEQAKKDPSPALTADEAYWTNRFAGEAPVLELPTDRPRPPLKTYASLREDAVLPEELVTRIKKAGARERVSLFAMLLAGFQALLARLSNQNDVVVGIPVAGQTEEGHQELVGHAVSMLPIRTQLFASQPVKSLLGDVRMHLLEAQEHQLFTIGSLLRKLPIKRDPSRLPLMSVIFNVDRGVGPAGLPFSGLQGQLAANARRFETYELFVNAVEYGGKITLECQYNSDLFDAATVQRWLAAYERLMRGIVSDLEEQKGGPLGTLPLLSADELAQLDRWNAQSALPVDPSLRVHDLFAAQAKKTPDKTAIRFEGRSVTYRELDTRSNAMARRLRELGVKRGQRVGLAVERSPEMLFGLFGILKAGAAYVPLDPGYPKDRLTYMVQDAALEVVVSQRSVVQDLELGAKHLVLAEDLPAEAPALEPSAYDAETEDVCYVIYTSGSTGKPKGVQVPHRSVVNIIESCKRTPGLEAQDTVLAVTTLSFDIAVSELILPFTVGATVEIASREVASDGARLLALLKQSGATFMDATPATYRLLLAAGWQGGDLKKCICTGEAMPKDLAQQLVKLVPSVWNGYGPTETTVWSTFYEVRAPVEKILIGKPVANTQLYILDPQRQRAPMGVIGELYIGGRGVTLGYLGRPDLTRERFIQSPFGEGLLYRTGDLVRYTRDGNVECLGRNDNQVKVRGFRIELGEIEDQLTQHPAVKQAAVVVREFKADDIRLVGYVVHNVGHQTSEADLRAHLKKTLPEYMVPAHLVKLDRMPLTPSGKIDRKALPEPDVGARVSEVFVAPRTDTEAGLAEIWQQILSVGRVGATDDFFALGGHSLLASQLLSRVQQKFGVQLSFRKIFEASTVAKLAALIETSRGKGQTSAQSAIARRPAGSPAPLSVAQARLVLLEQMDPGTKQVHALCAKWKLTGPMDVEAMRKAFAELVARHESLRSNLRVGPDGKQEVVVHATRDIPMEYEDLSELTVPDQDMRAIMVLRDYGGRPYDLEKDPPIRLMLHKRAEDEHELLLGTHNFAWDGWSFDIFLKDMSALYAAFVEGKPSPLPPLPVTYGDYSIWQQKWLESDEAKAQVKYWQEKLKVEVPPVELPTDSPRMGSRSSAGANEGVELSLELQNALVSFAQREGTTLFAVVFAAFNLVLSRHSGQRDLIIGCPVRARTRPELEDVIGPFTNNVLLHTHIKEGMTFLEMLHHVKDLILDAFSNQEVPIERLGVKPPLVRAYFSLQDARNRPPGFGPLNLTQVHTHPPNAANELMLWTMQRKNGLLAMLNYSTDLFRKASMRRLLKQLEQVLVEVLKDPKRPVAHLPMLPAEERQQIASWADMGKDGANTIWDGLSERSSALAEAGMGWARLVAERGGRGKKVAVKLPPSPARVAAVLGVLRAGAALAADGPADLELSAADAPSQTGDPGPLPPPDAVALWTGGVAVEQRPLARSFLDLAVRSGVKSLDSIWDGMDGAQEGWWMPGLLAAASGAATGSADPTVMLAPASMVMDVQRPNAKLLCVGHPSRKVRAALAAHPGTSFVVLVPDAIGVPVSAGKVEPGTEGRALFGRPLLGTPVRVLDAHNEMMPINAPGHLTVGDVVTPEKVRFLADRTLEHVGRSDGQVHFRGKLVNTDKIARAMAALPSVADAAVRRLEDREGEERLVAYVAAKQGEMFTETELRAEARKVSAVLPQVFIELDAMPRLPTGEVDEDRLPYPFARTSGQEFQPPRSNSEKLLAGLWQTALKLPRVGVYENFFDLGGYSLLCFQVLGELKEKTGLVLSPRTMLLGTLEQVAAELDAAGKPGQNAAKGAAAPAAAPQPPQPPPPSDGGGLLGKLRGWTKR